MCSVRKNLAVKLLDVVCFHIHEQPVLHQYRLTTQHLQPPAIMGTGKKEAARRSRDGRPTGDGMNNVKTKGENFYRSA